MSLPSILFLRSLEFLKNFTGTCSVMNILAAEVPSGYRMQVINGFVEELVVNDDPEYQWIDKIRTPRSSNEARQRLFSKLSGASKYCILGKISPDLFLPPLSVGDFLKCI